VTIVRTLEAVVTAVTMAKTTKTSPEVAPGVAGGPGCAPPGGCGGARGGEDGPGVDLPDIFCSLGSLIAEGRLPREWEQGGRGEARGYYEGPHVELPGKISRHKCSPNNPLCQKNELFRKHMLLLWQNNVPMCVEVLMSPECPGTLRAGLAVTSVPEPGTVLLEQWTVAVLPANLSSGPLMTSLALLQAVRSYLHFSQLSAWYSRSNGRSPWNILVRITIPGEEFATKFDRSPEAHYFPIASAGASSAISVSVRSLPRTEEPPAMPCSHVHAQPTEEEEAGKQGEAGSLPAHSSPQDLRRSLGKARLAAETDCPGRLTKSDSLDSMLGDSLLDPPQNKSKMAPRRYQSPSRCGSPSHEAPEPLYSAPPSYTETIASRLGPQSNPDDRLDRHDLLRRRDLTLFHGLHPRLLTGPRLSLPPRPPGPRPTLPCRAIPALATDRLPGTCTRQGKHVCEDHEVDEGDRHREDSDKESLSHSPSPPSSAYQQAELGAKQKGWSGRVGRCSRPYSRDSSADSSQESHRPEKENCLEKEGGSGLEEGRSREVDYLPCKDADYSDLERDISPKEMKSVLQSLAVARGSPVPGCSKESRRGSKGEEVGDYPTSSSTLEDLILCTKSRQPSIDDLAVEGSRMVEVYRTELPPPQTLPVLLGRDQLGFGSKGVVDVLERLTQYSTASSSSTTSPLSPTPSIPSLPPRPTSSPTLSVADLCQHLETKCCLEEEDGEQKELLPQQPRTRCASETSPRKDHLLDPLDIGFESFEFDWSRYDSAVERVEKRSAEEEEDDDSVPSSNKKNAFRKSLNSATSMVFHRRTGLPLTSSPAPMRRGVKFDFDSGISNPKDIKRALFEPQSPEESECGSPKKKKRDPRRLLSTSAPASISGNNLLGNFEESVLNGRLEPASTVEGFTAEIGASGSFQPRHLSFPVTVFFYTLCENSTIASPYLGHINLGKKGYRVPEKGTIQLTLFNPLGTVVKMFVVMYDLSDMPPSSQTFLRQRTLYMPCEESDGHPDSRKWLRYLIHLRLASSKTGKIYLHTDIRMIIFRKSDMDTATDYTPGKGFELRSFTNGPTNPKFSPRK